MEYPEHTTAYGLITHTIPILCRCRSANTRFKSSRAAISPQFQAFNKHYDSPDNDCHGGECNTLKCGILLLSLSSRDTGLRLVTGSDGTTPQVLRDSLL
jgi:hypothetical protein